MCRSLGALIAASLLCLAKKHHRWPYSRSSHISPRRKLASTSRTSHQLTVDFSLAWSEFFTLVLVSCREEFMAYAASRPKKLKRRVRKGIPDEFRGLAWQYLSGGGLGSGMCCVLGS